MAKKHFDEYVLKIKAQYKQFEDTLKEISKEAQEGLTDIDFVENFKNQIAPFKANYDRVMYLKFLLDQPAKKEKVPAFKRRLQKAMRELDKSNTTEAVLQENENILKNIKAN